MGWTLSAQKHIDPIISPNRIPPDDDFQPPLGSLRRHDPARSETAKVCPSIGRYVSLLHVVDFENPKNGSSFTAHGQRVKPFLRYDEDCKEDFHAFKPP